ncbi:hypothetical protein AB0903_09000 [Streptomyces sp. NPDC048389]|uniref:hypothetical protein n=1 Tax=Streptomyces sp. NPDC048389 TaxID=3154622 RepID=UPI003456521C
MEWEAGMRITDERMNDHTPVALTSSPTPAANFSVGSFTAYKSSGVTVFTVTLNYSGSTITADAAGNIADTACCTLPSDCRPQATMNTAWDKSGAAVGAVRIQPSGLCQITSLDPNATLASGNTVNFCGTVATG